MKSKTSSHVSNNASKMILFQKQKQKQDSSQDLRSALQEKAKAETGGKKRSTRKFKPGQAKTLSDLPQLSA